LAAWFAALTTGDLLHNEIVMQKSPGRQMLRGSHRFVCHGFCKRRKSRAKLRCGKAALKCGLQRLKAAVEKRNFYSIRSITYTERLSKPPSNAALTGELPANSCGHRRASAR
jgi:hypothetical protein